MIGAMRAVVVVLFLLAGCPNPNTFVTARPVPPGGVQVLAAAEGFTGPDVDSNTGQSKGLGVLPSPPTPGIRIGVADRVDIGARLPNLSSVAFDGKVLLLKGIVDLAFDPGLQWYSIHDSLKSDNGSTFASYD